MSYPGRRNRDEASTPSLRRGFVHCNDCGVVRSGCRGLVWWRDLEAPYRGHTTGADPRLMEVSACYSLAGGAFTFLRKTLVFTDKEDAHLKSDDAHDQSREHEKRDVSILLIILWAVMTISVVGMVPLVVWFLMWIRLAWILTGQA